MEAEGAEQTRRCELPLGADGRLGQCWHFFLPRCPQIRPKANCTLVVNNKHARLFYLGLLSSLSLEHFTVVLLSSHLTTCPRKTAKHTRRSRHAQKYLCAVAQIGGPLTVGAVGPLAQGLGELPLLQGRAALLPGCVHPIHFAARHVRRRW